MPHRDELRNDFAKAVVTGMLANPNTSRQIEAFTSKASISAIALLAKLSFDIAEAMVHEESHR